MVPTVVKMLGETFPEIKKRGKKSHRNHRRRRGIVRKDTFEGIEKFKEIAEGARGENRNVISGVEAFLLWESFGFPNDLTEIMCEENGLTLNNEEFDQVFKAAQEKSRMSSRRTPAWICCSKRRRRHGCRITTSQLQMIRSSTSKTFRKWIRRSKRF